MKREGWYQQEGGKVHFIIDDVTMCGFRFNEKMKKVKKGIRCYQCEARYKKYGKMLENYRRQI